MVSCSHLLGYGSTLVIAADGCSLECTACHEIVVPLEPFEIVIFAYAEIPLDD